MQHNSKSTQYLNKIYLYKKKLAEKAFEEQKVVVAASAAELLEITLSIASFNSNLANNNLYMEKEGVHSDASKMVRALNYKKQIDYDLERENFYRSLAEEDLHTQQLELKKRGAAIEKYKIKMDSLVKLEQRRKIKSIAREELAQEEMFYDGRQQRLS